jgi:hypothetical protein
LWWGTRDAAVRGGKHVVAAAQKAAKKVHIPLQDFAWQGQAFGDLFNSLGDKECHLIVNGEVYVGEAR